MHKIFVTFFSRKPWLSPLKNRHHMVTEKDGYLEILRYSSTTYVNFFILRRRKFLRFAFVSKHRDIQNSTFS